jgi:hypothetical protein
MSLESDGGMILTGENRRTRRKTCPSATLSTTNPTWIDPGTNSGLRCERTATNDLSHGTALPLAYWNVKIKIYQFAWFLYVFETRSFMLEEEYRLRVSESCVLRRNFHAGNMKWQEAEENRITRSSIICPSLLQLYGLGLMMCSSSELLLK